MNPRSMLPRPTTVRPGAPAWGRLPTLSLVLLCALLAPAAAQPRKADKSDKPREKAAVSATDAKKKQQPKVIDFDGLDLAGKMRSPQLLYFLERANEELERASLEKRSFIPHMVRSLEEEAL
jgi:hypothetical protein